MRIWDLQEDHPTGLTDQQRHTYLEFLGQWLGGHFMSNQSKQTLSMWKNIQKMFPPRIDTSMTLYRLVTVPLKYARSSNLTFRPAPHTVRRWSERLVGLDPVMGVAADIRGDRDPHRTCRLGIRSEIPADRILATTKTIREAFMRLRRDYFERYPEVITHSRDERWPGRDVITASHPGYPGGPDAVFDMDEIDYFRDVLRRKGGYLRQYECVIQTPPRITAQIVRVFRIGDKIIRPGNDDPHN